MLAEKIDQRTHEKRCNHGSYAYDSRDILWLSARQQEKPCPQQHTEKIRQYPVVLKFALFPCIGNDQCHRIIVGNAQICRNIYRAGKGYGDYAQQKETAPDGHVRIRYHLPEHPVCKLHHISQQKNIDKGGKPHIMPVKHQRKNKQSRIGNHIKRTETDGKHLIQPCHKRLERVHAKGSKLKKAHAHATQTNAENRHQYSLQHCLISSTFFHDLFYILSFQQISSCG